MSENNYKPMKQRMRATFSAGGTEEPRLTGVDRENERLLGVQITLEGEARGHGVWLDRQFCEDVAEQGNAVTQGVKVRFGHPAMCSDALGTYIGRATNFRVVDLKRKECETDEQVAGVLADIQLAVEAHKSPNGDLSGWIMDTAENSPDTFGQSIVFTYSDIKYLGKDGKFHMLSEEDANFEDSVDGRKYAVLGKLLGTDFTDTPAATDGVFSSDDLASEATELLEQHPEIKEVILSSPKNVVEFLKRSELFDALAEQIENARVSGLQKREAALRAQFEADMKAKADEYAAALAEKDASLAAAVGENEQLKKNLDETEKSLAELNASADALKEELAKANESLAATQADLEAERERLRVQTGPALGRPVETAPNGYTAREYLAKLPISERAAYYSAHKAEIDGKVK